MLNSHIVFREFYFKYFDIVGIEHVALFVYIIVFLTLITKYSVSLKKYWWVPLINVYSGLVMASLFSVFFDGSNSLIISSEEPAIHLIIRSFNPVSGIGKVMYGGYIGPFVALWLLYLLKIIKKNDFPAMIDISAISVSILFALWRISCFANGCCFGKPSEKFGVIFNGSTVPYDHLRNTEIFVDEIFTVPLLPTQLISSTANLLIFLFLCYFFFIKKSRYPYFYFFTQAFLYGIFRFVIEFFRMDVREHWGVLSISQWIPLVMMPFILWYFYSNRKEIVDLFKKKL